jgi:hypothetical protein
MSKKSETKKAAGQKCSHEQGKQTAAMSRGREHTIAEGVQAMTRRDKHAATPDTPPVELVIDAAGIHSLTAGARPVEKTQAAPTKAKPTPTEGVPEQPDDSGELVVFAFRLSRAERDLIHSAAGSAKASKFVRELAVAAARRDGDAMQRIVEGLQPNSR